MPTAVWRPGLDGDHELGADPVIGGDQDRIAIAAGLEVEQTAEAAERRIGAGPRRRARQRLDRLDQRVSGRNIDARIGIGDPVPAALVCLRPCR